MGRADEADASEASERSVPCSLEVSLTTSFAIWGFGISTVD